MSKYHVDNEELKQEIISYIQDCEFETVKDSKGNWKRKIKKRGKMSDKLGKMIWTIADGLSTKGNWRSYTWKKDFVSYAVLTALKYMHNFDEERYTNAHGYINMICYRAFQQYTKQEKAHSKSKQFLYDHQDDVLDEGHEMSAINYGKLKQ